MHVGLEMNRFLLTLGFFQTLVRPGGGQLTKNVIQIDHASKNVSIGVGNYERSWSLQPGSLLIIKVARLMLEGPSDWINFTYPIPSLPTPPFCIIFHLPHDEPSIFKKFICSFNDDDQCQNVTTISEGSLILSYSGTKATSCFEFSYDVCTSSRHRLGSERTTTTNPTNPSTADNKSAHVSQQAERSLTWTILTIVVPVTIATLFIIGMMATCFYTLRRRKNIAKNQGDIFENNIVPNDGTLSVDSYFERRRIDSTTFISTLEDDILAGYSTIDKHKAPSGRRPTFEFPAHTITKDTGTFMRMGSKDGESKNTRQVESQYATMSSLTKSASLQNFDCPGHHADSSTTSSDLHYSWLRNVSSGDLRAHGGHRIDTSGQARSSFDHTLVYQNYPRRKGMR